MNLRHECFSSDIQLYTQSTDQLISLSLTQRQICDLELIFNGGFYPLNNFMNQENYEHVLDHMRLSDGTLWPIPITLDVSLQFAETIKMGQHIALRHPEGLLLGVLAIDHLWKINKTKEAKAIYDTEDSHHPGVFYLYYQIKDFYISGQLFAVSMPSYYDFTHLRYAPSQLRAKFKQQNWKKIIAFQTRNPMHKAHQELTLQAAKKTGGNILIHPVVGTTKPGDIHYYSRVKCYEHIMPTYPDNLAMLSLLPLSMRMAGPKEALWHALIRKNYGCTHFIIGRDHAGPGKNKEGKDYYDVYAAQTLTLQYQHELGIEIIPFQEMVYSLKQNRYFFANEFPNFDQPASISGTELRKKLSENSNIPAWFSYPAVIDELRKTYPTKKQQGFTLFLTGLPCSGKSTLANVLMIQLQEMTHRKITLLDGDIVRAQLSPDLGFTAADRELNITRIGFVANEITKHGGIAICALVAPFENTRKKVRNNIQENGGFIEIYVSTPLDVCEKRDRKKLYQAARQGLIKQFTGISDPYEPPASPELSIDTAAVFLEEAVKEIIKKIQALGYI
jgi:sulfate adenylyltransferase